MANKNRKKIGAYTGMAVASTALVIVVVILLNSIASTLAERYDGWYVDMNPTLRYPASDAFYDYVDDYVIPEIKDGQKIRIIFCEEEDWLVASDDTLLVFDMATELAKTYPDHITVEHLDALAQPAQARKYQVTSTTDVVVVYDEENPKKCALSDFYVLDDDSSPTAFRGHRRLATVLRTAVCQELPVCYMTLNHGETPLQDKEIRVAVADAGYEIRQLNLLHDGIPEDCDLLVTYNPDRDFTHRDGTSDRSEIEFLRTYMENGGKYMVFVTADTFAAGGFPNLEGYLSEWGVTFAHATGNAEVEECYLVRDPGHALTTDGYTILARDGDGEAAANILNSAIADGGATVYVSNATVIRPSEGFVDNEKGQLEKDGTTVTTLLASYAGAEAWAAGRAVDRAGEDGYALMTLSQRTNNDKTGYLLACSAASFASEDGMQSAVYDNKAIFLSVVESMGKTDVPLHIQLQPIRDNTIRTMTTAQARTVTWVAVLTPSAVLLAAGLWVLLRRRYS